MMNLPFDGDELGKLVTQSLPNLKDHEVVALLAWHWHQWQFFEHGRHRVYAQFMKEEYIRFFNEAMLRKLVTLSQLYVRPN